MSAFKDTPEKLMTAHDRLRASGFPIVSIVSARTPVDARVWVGQWARRQGRGIIVPPDDTPQAAMATYKARAGEVRLDAVEDGKSIAPVLLLPGDFEAVLPAAIGLAEADAGLPVAVACGLAGIVESLLSPAIPMHVVSAALQGLVPVDDAERAVLKTVAEGREVTPFLRGACEGLVYYMLQVRPATRDRFEVNARVENSTSSRSHEVDLLCRRHSLVIEIDGKEHDTVRRRKMDERKQADLEKQGYRVRRFSNDDVIEDPVGVWKLIAEQLDKQGQ